MRPGDALTGAGVNSIIPAKAGIHDRAPRNRAIGSAKTGPGLRRDDGLSGVGSNIVHLATTPGMPAAGRDSVP